MIKLRYFLPLMAFTAIVSSCSKDKEGFQTTETGLKYKFITSVEGETPKPGDVMILEMSYRTSFDSVMWDSRAISDSFTVDAVAPTFRGGVEEGFMMMSPGDSAHFKVSADSLFLRTLQRPMPSNILKGDFIRFFVKMKRIVPKAVSDSIRSAYDISMRKKEFELIELFLKQNNMDVMPTKNGAYLWISKPGIGDFPQPGDTVFATYTGRLLDGTIFDTTDGKSPEFSFVVGRNEVIEGWEECIPMLNSGTIARMVIPSDLAYGAEEYGALKPYSTLVFDVMILGVRKGSRESASSSTVNQSPNQ